MDVYKDKMLYDIKASTRDGHPPTSHEAEERVQPHVGKQAAGILRSLQLHGPHFASDLDTYWYGVAHRRMKDLETAGFVSRERKKGDRELTCTITKDGIEYLEGLK